MVTNAIFVKFSGKLESFHPDGIHPFNFERQERVLQGQRKALKASLIFIKLLKYMP